MASVKMIEAMKATTRAAPPILCRSFVQFSCSAQSPQGTPAAS
jgi:hypothetical protein